MKNVVVNSKKSDYIWLLTLALLVRGLAAWPQQQPNYMDAAYYTVTGQNLAQGRGFVEDFVWNYLGNPGSPPQPSHLYWPPLTSLLAAAGMLLGGDNYRAAQIGFVLVSALLAPLAAYSAIALGGRRWHAWLAGLLAIFSGFYFPYWTAIDSFALFGVTGSLALLLASESERIKVEGGRMNFSAFCLPPSSLFFAGLLAGLAHLTRADGVLIFVSIELFLLVQLVRSATRNTQRATHKKLRITNYELRILVLPLLGYLLVMLPWFWRNWQVAGAPLPVAGSQTIWLASYDDLFSYGREHSPATLLAAGLGPVLAGRWWALMVNLQTVLAVWGMIILLPLALVGGWHLRRRGAVQLNALYAGLLLAVMTLVFPFPGARGGLFHSGAALLPVIYATTAIGLEVVVGWVAARRRGWRANSARQVFGVGLVAIAVTLSLFLYNQRVLKNNAWNGADAAYPAIAAWVMAHDATAVVMIGNPPAYRYHGGGPSVVVPNENLDITLQAARRYGVRYLVLDSNRPAPLAEVFARPESAAGLTIVERLGDVVIFQVDR
ncbi:MAG: hypothetical protein FOGNACKC_02371 [Anaerolineae bacterium]|nr:hypothetical protein [Anaerolineae bacterium]